ncbi:MAG: SGNH/GDSL hydrolase family protein [Chitinophagaceae bacterium]
MREKLIKKASSSLVAVVAMLLLPIFIVAMKHPQQKKAYSYLALGDSYTIGEKVTQEENFPNQAVGLLRENGLDFAAPKIVAKTGWTTDELQAGIKKGKLESHYDFVSLLIGVNNQYRQRTVADYIPQFESLLDQALKYARNKNNRVIVISIPDWGVTPFASDRDREKIALEIDEYNRANKEIADKYRVHYINITLGNRKATGDKEMVTGDGLHPSGKEYKKWAAELAAVIKSEL